MRVRLALRATIPNKRISTNYHYSLSAAIYKLLQFGSPKFSEFLHNIGYQNAGKTYKLFSFALRFNKFKIDNRVITLIDPVCSLIITSPLIEEFIQNFVIGTFADQTITIVADNIKTVFVIEIVETLTIPEFPEESKFKMLSPLVISTGVSKGDDRKTNKFLTYDDDIELISRIFNQNLKNKYKIVHNKEYNGKDLVFSWDDDYAKRQIKNGKRLTKMIKYLWDIKNPTFIRGMQIPIYLKGDNRLTRIGYDCGFGERGSQGFGLVEKL